MIRLGTRGSRLALCQAGLAADALRAAGLGPVAIVPISTAGDRDRRHSFSELGGRGVFSSELEEALRTGQIDVAVHSAKDLTTDDADDLALAAVLPRADPRDAWCGPETSLRDVAEGARVGTASTRRTAQLGSVQTRSRRRGAARQRRHAPAQAPRAWASPASCSRPAVSTGSVSSTRSASAFRPRSCCPRSARAFSPCRPAARRRSLLAPVNDADGMRVLRAERAAAGTFGGGCLAPVAAHAELLESGALRLRVWIGLPDGSASASADGDGDDPEALGPRRGGRRPWRPAAVRCSRRRAHDGLPGRRGARRSGPDHGARPRAAASCRGAGVRPADRRRAARRGAGRLSAGRCVEAP